MRGIEGTPNREVLPEGRGEGGLLPYKRLMGNLVPRALFPGFGGGAGKGPGIGRSHDHQTPSICGCNKLAFKLAYDRIR